MELEHRENRPLQYGRNGRRTGAANYGNRQRGKPDKGSGGAGLSASPGQAGLLTGGAVKLQEAKVTGHISADEVVFAGGP